MEQECLQINKQKILSDHLLCSSFSSVLNISFAEEENVKMTEQEMHKYSWSTGVKPKKQSWARVPVVLSTLGLCWDTKAIMIQW